MRSERERKKGKEDTEAKMDRGRVKLGEKRETDKLRQGPREGAVRQRKRGGIAEMG